MNRIIGKGHAMKRKRLFTLIFPILGLAFLLGAFAFSRRDVKAEAVTEPGNEIVVTIGTVDRSAIAEADTLRKHFKFKEAIAEYQKVLETQGLSTSLRAEAEYNIGLSHTWLGEHDQAEAVFTRMFDTYKDDPNAVAYAQYCLAWIEVQREQYMTAVQRLQRVLSEGKCTDRELCARTQFQIGKIYLSFLKNKTAGMNALRLVVANYPDTKAYEHPWLNSLKKGM
jgi:tetratricopeptide (TPR) repeat protein